jgi:hypothetical protein
MGYILVEMKTKRLQMTLQWACVIDVPKYLSMMFMVPKFKRSLPNLNESKNQVHRKYKQNSGSFRKSQWLG